MDNAVVEAMRNDFNIDWRSTKRRLIGQIEHLYLKEDMADVHFLFKNGDIITRIPAHKFVLSVASEVFAKEIIYEPKKDESDAAKQQLEKDEHDTRKRAHLDMELHVTDEKIEIDAFRSMLLFIYRGYEYLELTGDTVMRTLYVAKKYMIKQLERYCIDFLLDNISAENVFTVMQYSIECETDERLLEKCLEFLRANTEKALLDEGFLKASQSCINLLMEQNCLTISEADLFQSLLRWGNFACEAANLPICPENVRTKIGPKAIKLVRFPVMSLEEFREIAVPSSIISGEEQRDIMFVMLGNIGMNIGLKPLSPIPFSQIPRESSSYQTSMELLKHGTKLSLLIRIKNFRCFIESRGEYQTKRFYIGGIEWYIELALYLYCYVEEKYVQMDSADEDGREPESLGVFVHGESPTGKECRCNVDAIFKVKGRPLSAKIRRDYSSDFEFNADNDYSANRGYHSVATLEALLDPDQRLLHNDSTLELYVELSVATKYP